MSASCRGDAFCAILGIYPNCNRRQIAILFPPVEYTNKVHVIFICSYNMEICTFEDQITLLIGMHAYICINQIYVGIHALEKSRVSVKKRWE